MTKSKSLIAACVALAVSLGAFAVPASAASDHMMHKRMMMHHKMKMMHHKKMMMHKRMMHKRMMHRM